MKRNTIRNFALSGIAAAVMLFVSVPASYARGTVDGGMRAKMMSSSDQLTGKQAHAVSAPVSGQPVPVIETLTYLNKPWFHSYTSYKMQRQLMATYSSRLGYDVLQDNEGQWYAFSPGSAEGTSLPGKPQVNLPDTQSRPLDGNDSGSLSSVGAGSVVNGSPQLAAQYRYTHVEQLDDVNYRVSTAVDTQFVADQSAWFANVSGTIYSVDSNGRVVRYNDKPSADRGMQGGMISAADSTSSYPDVAISGGIFLITWNHVHDEPFQHVRYQTQEQKRADYVPEVTAYMTWIDGTEYEAAPGTSSVYRLTDRPVVQLPDGRLRRISVLDSPRSTVVYSVTDTKVVVRDFYRHVDDSSSYIAQEYYVDHVGTMYYNTTYSVWMVEIDGSHYAVAWGDDNVNDSSVTVLHAPSGSTRPQYVVPSTSNDGMPPAVVPGADQSGGWNTAPVPAPAPYSGGIPGRANTIPGRAPAPANCIPGRC